jgi:Family of unknown function (DUF6084)
MPELRFDVVSAEPEPFAVAPLLSFKLRISQPAAAVGEPVRVEAVSLRCQVRIDPARRSYTAGEQEKLLDLFGIKARWGETLRPMLWTHASVAVGSFTDSVLVDLPVPCTFDFNVATTKMFHALDGGEIPLTLLFSGTVFHEGDDGALQVAQVPWDREAAFRLPVAVWKDMMERYYPNSAWLCLRRDVFDRLYEHKRRHELLTWEEALESLLPCPEDDRAAARALRCGAGKAVV